MGGAESASEASIVMRRNFYFGARAIWQFRLAIPCCSPGNIIAATIDLRRWVSHPVGNWAIRDAGALGPLAAPSL